MEKAARDAILRQGVVLPETPRERRELAGLEEDLRSTPLRGRPLTLRLRNHAPSADAYLAATRGPRPYMLRLREIEKLTAGHQQVLGRAWQMLAEECDGDRSAFARRWRALAEGVVLDDVNDLIERHNRWYPVESQLPMDPRTGDYALVSGRDYRLAPLDVRWILERFPAELELASAAS